MNFFRSAITRAAIVLVMLSFTLPCSASEAAVSTTLPRAWLVSKGNKQAILVAESHLGTPNERDQYYVSVIQPSYAAADTALMETVLGPEQLHNELLERNLPCPGDAKNRQTDRLAPAFQQLAAAARANAQEVPNWLEDATTLPEFLYSSLLDNFAGSTLGQSYSNAVKSQLGMGTSERLRTSATGPTEKYLNGLESLKTRRNIFCNASAAHRQDFLVDKAMQLTALLMLKRANPSYQGLSKFGAPMGRFFESYLRCVDQAIPCAVEQASPERELLLQAGWHTAFSPGTVEITLKQRTQAWVPLIEQAMTEHNKTVVVVGVMHLPNLQIQGKTEVGLINLLRERGNTVTPITGPEQLNSSFLAPSLRQRVRAWFGQK